MPSCNNVFLITRGFLERRATVNGVSASINPLVSLNPISFSLSNRQQLFPVFEVLLPTFAKLLAPDRNWSDRQWGICVFDDLIEFGGPPSIKYQEAFLPTLVGGIVDKSAEVGITRTVRNRYSYHLLVLTPLV